MSSVRDAALELVGALESLNIPYAIGGSFASSIHGVARPTQDLDFIAAILPAQADAVAAALQKDFYVDSEAIRQAIRYRRSFNVIHFATGFKIDVFPVSSHDLGPQQLKRRQVEETEILGGPAVSLPVISAEDTTSSNCDGIAMAARRRSASGTTCAISSLSRETGSTRNTSANGPGSWAFPTCWQADSAG